MNWTNAAVKIIQIFFLEITAGAAGSMLILFLMLAEKIPKWKNSRLKLVWLKLSALIFLIPLAAPAVLGSRFEISINGVVASSDFGQIATMPMQKFYLIAGIFWMIGMGVAAIFRIDSYRKYKNILNETVEVTDERIKKLAQLHIERAEISNVCIMENNLLEFPLTRGMFRKEIILPARQYAEKELHMILEHECSHVKYHDLFWKKVVLFICFIHYWNPFSYVMLKMLAFQLEVECDIRTCEDNQYFTMKEYGFYLAGMPETVDAFFLGGGVAMKKSQKDIFRRLEGIIEGKKYRKRTAVASCMLLTLLAVVPSYAASEGFVRANERWVRETETAAEVLSVDYKSLEQTAMAADDDGVQEIDLTEVQGEFPAGETITLDRTIPAKTRILYHWQTMKKGDIVTISTGCSDSSIVYRIGIRKKTGEMTYVEGSGDLLHPFMIGEAGEYTAYVENRSSKSMKVTGIADYSNR